MTRLAWLIVLIWVVLAVLSNRFTQLSAVAGVAEAVFEMTVFATFARKR